MTIPCPYARLSPRRALLASFANGYAVAVQLRQATGFDHYVVATGNPVQPYRVTRERPADDAAIMARVA